MTVTYPTLEHIAQEARPYPTHLLDRAETGLCLFSAAFMGHNEAIHFALKNIQTTCVDLDQDRLAEMAPLYPEDWEFVCADAWGFAEEANENDETWDVVSVDTFRGNATERSLTTLDLWCSIAARSVVATLEVGQVYDTPEGWKPTYYVRNSEVLWLCLRRAA